MTWHCVSLTVNDELVDANQCTMGGVAIESDSFNAEITLTSRQYLAAGLIALSRMEYRGLLRPAKLHTFLRTAWETKHPKTGTGKGTASFPVRNMMMRVIKESEKPIEQSSYEKLTEALEIVIVGILLTCMDSMRNAKSNWRAFKARRRLRKQLDRQVAMQPRHSKSANIPTVHCLN